MIWQDLWIPLLLQLASLNLKGTYGNMKTVARNCVGLARKTPRDWKYKLKKQYYQIKYKICGLSPNFLKATSFK